MSRAEISRLLSGCVGLYLFNEVAGGICNDYMGIAGPGIAWGSSTSPSTSFDNKIHRPLTPWGPGWKTRTNGQSDYNFIYVPSLRLRPLNSMDFSVVTVLRSDTTTAHDTFGGYGSGLAGPGMPIYPATPKMQYQILGTAGVDATTTATVGGIYSYGCSARNTLVNPHPYALYFEGRAVGSGSYSGAASLKWNVPFIGTFGNTSSGNPADYMTLFFFGFWDRWLSAEEHSLIAAIARYDREMFIRQSMWSMYTAGAVATPWLYASQRSSVIGGR